MNPAALIRAAAFSAEKHRDQRRKDAAASPYINHPIAVAAVLAVEVGETDQSVLLAALLHDTVEDTDTSFAELEANFGIAVAGLVREMTDDKTLPKHVRKQRQIDEAPTASSRAKRLKIADKICNVRDVATNPAVEWSLNRRRAYLDWAEHVVSGCRGENAALDALFDRVLREAREALGLGA